MVFALIFECSWGFLLRLFKYFLLSRNGIWEREKMILNALAVANFQGKCCYKRENQRENGEIYLKSRFADTLKMDFLSVSLNHHSSVMSTEVAAYDLIFTHGNHKCKNGLLFENRPALYFCNYKENKENNIRMLDTLFIEDFIDSMEEYFHF